MAFLPFLEPSYILQVFLHRLEVCQATIEYLHEGLLRHMVVIGKSMIIQSLHWPRLLARLREHFSFLVFLSICSSEFDYLIFHSLNLFSLQSLNHLQGFENSWRS